MSRALSLLGCALGARNLAVSAMPPADRRWLGRMGSAGALSVAPDAPHRTARLQVLRRALDLRPEGRWALRVAADDGGLVGPLSGAQRRRGAKRLDLQACLATWPYALLLRRLFLWVDGQRVDDSLAASFPGAARDVALDPAPQLPAFLEDVRRQCPPPRDAEAALRVALVLHQHVLAGGSGARRLRLVQEIADILVRPDDLADAGEEGEGLFGRGSGRSSAQPAKKPARRTDGAAIPDPAADGEESPLGVADPVEAAKDDAVVQLPRVRALPAARRADRVILHDEWDYHLQSYRPQWAAVHERRLEGKDLAFLEQLRKRFPALSQQIRRRFAQLSADARRRVRRMQDGESVDLDAALEALVARRAQPGSTDDRLYQAETRRLRDVSVALLLDMSGSTNFALPAKYPAVQPAEEDAPDRYEMFWQSPRGSIDDGTPPRRVIDVAKDAVGLLGEALDVLGDRFAVFAFSGSGRAHVDFAVVKDFSEPWSARQGAALSAVTPQGSTRTGAAVRHALRHLAAERARRKILIVLSDGYPQDSDYGPDQDDIEYGLRDTAHALREAQRAGVSAFNVSIDAAANDYLRRMCPRDRYWVVSDVEALPAGMLRLYRLMTLAA